MVVAADITGNRNGRYTPNTVLINPINALSSKLIKNTQGNYIVPSLVNGANFGGLRIVESSQVARNTMVVGDFIL